MNDAAAPSRPPLPQLSLVEPDRFGRYRLLTELGGGGMARVWLADYDGPGGFVKPCVVKKVRRDLVQDTEFRSMFLSEARVAALLSHPNIVQAFDFGETQGEYYLALEYVEGASLADVLRVTRARGLPPGLSVVVHVGICLCEALSYAHSARSPEGAPLNLVHRDVTPANVLVSRTGAVKLADFGVVKSSINAAASKPGVLKGKLSYLSPEQARLEPLDHRADLFSLGLLLYELATGRAALARGSVEDSVRAAARADIARPSTFMAFPPRLELILSKALQARRDDRYACADAMRADLEAFRAEQRWGPATRELAELLSQLFPDGMPTRRRPSPRLALAPVSEAPVEVDCADVELIEGPDGERPVGPFPWREVAVAAALGLGASAAFWLFVL